MPRAKTLNSDDFQYLSSRLPEVSKHALRDRVILIATFKAGLRIAEVAGLCWRDVCTPRGSINQVSLQVPNGIAKKDSGRELPMHPALFQALTEYRASLPLADTVGKMPIIRMAHSSQAYDANSLQKYMNRLYVSCGFSGVTTHSGRRTALTTLARTANTYGCSLRDVQKFAGHRDIETTEVYVDVSDRFHELVGAL